MRELTEKQRRILEFIEDFSEREGMSPTVYEIGAKFSIKTSTVFAHLKALQRKQQLTRSSKARSISLRQDKRPRRVNTTHLSFMTAIPLLGRINAGSPADSKEFHERDVYVDTQLLARYPGDAFFALRVQGESMRDMGILDGDIVVVRQTTNVRSGDVVAALADGEATVKSYYPLNDGRIELRPANPDYATLLFPAEAVSVQGKVVMLQREL